MDRGHVLLAKLSHWVRKSARARERERQRKEEILKRIICIFRLEIAFNIIDSLIIRTGYRFFISLNWFQTAFLFFFHLFRSFIC